MTIYVSDRGFGNIKEYGLDGTLLQYYFVGSFVGEFASIFIYNNRIYYVVGRDSLQSANLDGTNQTRVLDASRNINDFFIHNDIVYIGNASGIDAFSLDSNTTTTVTNIVTINKIIIHNNTLVGSSGSFLEQFSLDGNHLRESNTSINILDLKSYNGFIYALTASNVIKYNSTFVEVERFAISEVFQPARFDINNDLVYITDRRHNTDAIKVYNINGTFSTSFAPFDDSDDSGANEIISIFVDSPPPPPSTINAKETIPVLDTVSILRDQPINETLPVSDIITGSTEHLEFESEAVQTSDMVNSLRERMRPTQEVVDIGDAVNILADETKNLAEDIGDVTDTLQNTKQFESVFTSGSLISFSGPREIKIIRNFQVGQTYTNDDVETVTIEGEHTLTKNKCVFFNGRIYTVFGRSVYVNNINTGELLSDEEITTIHPSLENDPTHMLLYDGSLYFFVQSGQVPRPLKIELEPPVRQLQPRIEGESRVETPHVIFTDLYTIFYGLDLVTFVPHDRSEEIFTITSALYGPNGNFQHFDDQFGYGTRSEITGSTSVNYSDFFRYNIATREVEDFSDVIPPEIQENRRFTLYIPHTPQPAIDTVSVIDVATRGLIENINEPIQITDEIEELPLFAQFNTDVISPTDTLDRLHAVIENLAETVDVNDSTQRLRDITLQSGIIYVSDFNRGVERYNANTGEYIDDFNPFERRRFDGISFFVYNDEVYYVYNHPTGFSGTTINNTSIRRYSLNGEFIQEYNISMLNGTARNIAEYNGNFYIVNNENRVFVFRAGTNQTNSNLNFDFPTNGEEGLIFYNGVFYRYSRSARRISAYNPDGTPNTNKSFNVNFEPGGIVGTPNDTFLIAEYNTSNVHLFDITNNELIRTFTLSPTEGLTSQIQGINFLDQMINASLVSDSIPIQDQASSDISSGEGEFISDELNINDFFLRDNVTRNITDNIDVTDNLQFVAGGVFVSLLDIIPLTDNIEQDKSSRFLDNIAITDSFSTDQELIKATQDLIDLIEFIRTARTFGGIGASDSFDISDAVTLSTVAGFIQNAIDTFDLDDAVEKSRQFVRGESDVLFQNDSLQTDTGKSRGGTDNIQLGDTITALGSRVSSAFDSIRTTDIATIGMVSRLQTLSDSIPTLDGVIRSISRFATSSSSLVDNAIKGGINRFRQSIENINIVEKVRTRLRRNKPAETVELDLDLRMREDGIGGYESSFGYRMR